MASGFGRGGRGAQLLKAQQAPARKPGEVSPPTQPATEGGPALGSSMGRGAQLQALLQQKQAAAPGSSSSGAQVTAPLGRGSLLQKFGAKPAAPGSTSISSTSSVGGGPALAAGQLGMGRGLLGRGALLSSRQQGSGEPSPTPSPPRPVETPRPRVPDPAPAPMSASMSEASREDEGPSRLAQQLQRLKLDTQPVQKHGISGRKVTVATNSIRVGCHFKGMYQYAVTFSPQVDSKKMRFKLLFDDHRDTIKEPHMFDGAILCLLHKMPQDETFLSSSRPTDGEEVRIQIKLVRCLPLSACIQQMNVLFRKIMRILKMVDVQRRYFNPFDPAKVAKHKLEVWPGYVTAIEEQEGGLLLLLDVAHKVLRTETVLDVMVDMNSAGRGGKEGIMKALIGETVLTKYNNKTYRVDDIVWDKNPLSKFQTFDGPEISYVDYYRKNYNKEIHDVQQPLLLHRPKKRDIQQKRGRCQLESILLVPELCNMTGLTDKMRSDWQVMKDLATHTRISPANRQRSMRELIDKIKSHPQAQAELDKWGLTLEPDLERFEARQLEPEQILFGKNQSHSAGQEADWGRHISKNPVITAVDLTDWIMCFTGRDQAKARDFMAVMKQEGPKMGIRIQPPYRGGEVVQNDSAASYLNYIKNNQTPETQLVLCIFPTSRDDRYNAVKIQCCCTNQPVPSQMINARTISDQRKLRSVVQKVILQINAKLGGELWGVKIPSSGLMVCGIDVCHDKGASKSVAGLVCSMNSSCTRWFSRTAVQMQRQELVDVLKPCFMAAIRKYADVNGNPPSRIFLFRDGVGDGQLNHVSQHEARQLEECFKHFGGYSPKLVVIVVQKRINQRIFLQPDRSPHQLENPPPGTVVDKIITRRDWYDFFTVSQHVRQGTVSPTHYVVVHDGGDWDPDRVHKITYKMTHLYYNWPGTVRVPAPCQYAHKLAYLQGTNLKKPFDSRLGDRLFFL